MTRMRNISRILGLAALVAVAATSCGDVVRQGRSPVFLVDRLAGRRHGRRRAAARRHPAVSDVITNVTTPGAVHDATTPCPTIFNDLGQVTLRAALKDIGADGTPSAPTTNNEVTITRVPRRVPPRRRPQHARASTCRTRSTAPRPARCRRSGTLTLGFELVRHTRQSRKSPLVQLEDQRRHHHDDRRGDVLRAGPGRQRHQRHRVRSRSTSATSGINRRHGKAHLAGRRRRGARCCAPRARDQSDGVPPLTGPSEFALSLRVTATPDSISQDGASQSSIVVTAFGPNGQAASRGVALRMDMIVNGDARRTTARCRRGRS